MDQPLVQPVEQLPGQPVVTRATVADRSRVVETVAAAFAADPAFRWYFPDDRTYHRQAVAFAGHLFDRRVGAGTVWIVAGSAAVAMWQPPGMAEVAAELSLPAEVTGRLTAWDAAVHAALPQQPHWYLGVLATHPAYAGRRWGRAVLAAGLRAATDAGLPSYLETANPRNVELYGRAGWRVTEELTVAGLPAWVMTHPGGAPTG